MKPAGRVEQAERLESEAFQVFIEAVALKTVNWVPALPLGRREAQVGEVPAGTGV